MAESIRVNNDEVQGDIPMITDGTGCQLCLKNLSKYTCPRCNVKYCSVECYRGRKHVQCSESFYKKCVIDSLQQETGDDESKRKMVEMLKRFEKEETQEDLDELGENLEERLEGLNLDRDTEKIWEKLTIEERQEFQRAVDDGYIGSLVDAWVPWWIDVDKSSSDPIASESCSNTSLPKMLQNVPRLSSLIKSKPPSEGTKYNLVNLLYSYVYICRFYNGCHYDFLGEAVDRLWKLSAVLYHNVNFSSLDACLRSVFEASLQQKELFNSEKFSLSIIDDVLLLVKGSKTKSEPNFVLLVLSDIYMLFAKAVKLSKSVSMNEDTSKDYTKSLWLAKKKIMFMLAWCFENMDDCLTLVPFIPMVKEAISLEVKQLQEDKLKIQKSRTLKTGKKLIEELN